MAEEVGDAVVYSACAGELLVDEGEVLGTIHHHEDLVHDMENNPLDAQEYQDCAREPDDQLGCVNRVYWWRPRVRRGAWGGTCWPRSSSRWPR